MDDANEKITLHRDGESIRIHIPLKFKRRGGRKEIIVPEGLEKFQSKKQPAKYALLVALTRAFRWKELLETGQISSMSELAKKFRVDPSYLSRILRLTLLAPNIVEAIINGGEPSGLSLAKLTMKLPMEWSDQQDHFGFPLKQ